MEVRVDGTAGLVRIDVWNPTRSAVGPTSRGGHGLDGVRERVRLFGGTAASGPDASGRWHLRATFPTGAP